MKPRIIVDTCVVSYIFKGDSRAHGYRSQLEGMDLCVSFMTLAELYCWPIERQWGTARTDNFMIETRKYLVLPYNERVCWQWAFLTNYPGHPMSESDAWIAATALAFKLPLATHNISDFNHIADLELIHVTGATQ